MDNTNEHLLEIIDIFQDYIEANGREVVTYHFLNSIHSRLAKVKQEIKKEQQSIKYVGSMPVSINPLKKV